MLGLAELSKSSWLILFVLWPVLAGVWRVARYRREARRPAAEGDSSASAAERSTAPLSPSARRPLGREHAMRIARGLLHPGLQLAGLLALALYLLNLGYAFDGSFTRLGEYEFISSSLTGLTPSGEVGNRFRDSWLGNVPVPLPKQYVLGLDLQKHDFESWSRPSYLRGEWKKGGWWYYYLYGLWVKVPHGVQWLVLMSLLYPLWRWCVGRRVSSVESRAPVSRDPINALDSGHSTLDLIVLCTPGVTLFVLVSSQTAMNEHFRYVLPLLGTATVLLGRASAYWTGEESGS